jgi:DNA invertase Pin-like site-specific DNA recombinase
MRVAKAKGRLRGGSPSSTRLQEAHLVALHRAGEHSTAELGQLFGVGRSTVYRAIERDTRRREQQTPPEPVSVARSTSTDPAVPLVI